MLALKTVLVSETMTRNLKARNLGDLVVLFLRMLTCLISLNTTRLFPPGETNSLSCRVWEC